MAKRQKKTDRPGLAETIRSLSRLAASGDQSAIQELKEGLEILAKQMPKDPSLGELLELRIKAAAGGDSHTQRELEEVFAIMLASMIEVQVVLSSLAEEGEDEQQPELKQHPHQNIFEFRGLPPLKIELVMRDLRDHIKRQHPLPGIPPA